MAAPAGQRPRSRRPTGARVAALFNPVQLITGGVPYPAGHGARARALMHAALREHNVEVIDGTAIEVNARASLRGDGRAVPSDATLLRRVQQLRMASRRPRLRSISVALSPSCAMQSTSHSFVFAAGDTAALTLTLRVRNQVSTLSAQRRPLHQSTRCTDRYAMCHSRRGGARFTCWHRRTACNCGPGVRGQFPGAGYALEKSYRSRLHCETEARH